MDDEEILGWIRRQAEGARCVFSVCTGALILGAAGLLQGRRATTHWASIDLLPYFGATGVNERVVTDGKFVFAAGVTSGIDGALRVAADLRGDDVAQGIQLAIAYAPEPPFNSRHAGNRAAAVLARAKDAMRQITAQRERPHAASRRGSASRRDVERWAPKASLRGALHRFDDFRISGAAAEIAGEIVLDVVVARIGILLQQLMRHQHEARRAEAALERAAIDEGLLHFGQGRRRHRDARRS